VFKFLLFFMSQFLPVAYLRESFVPFGEANISIATHALHYGTAAFGGLRALINPENARQVLLFRLDKHAARLSQSAKMLQYSLEPEQIRELIVQFVKQNKPNTDSYIRPLVYASDLGIAPRLHNLEKDFLIYGLELGDYFNGDVACCFSSWTRQEDRSLPLRGKISGAYITSALSKSEAVARGYDEAILLNTQGKVCEASGMNLFLVRGGKIITPSVNQDILEGITRLSVIQIAQDLGFVVEERPVDKTELLIADEVFLTGTAARITSLKTIENYALPGVHPIADQLKAKLTSISLGQEKDYESWITRIDI
jgi:branched-chain amino acid aminotransferase